ncbi:hypothetical protein COCCADRAFT_39314 [Bipolaris zeicola 26-R-13]|uniref:Uncharacterized protein n=1 Tax=Cochliobolus carbonum (strain 26-R-13) TaxID=930089 RepID=W6Y5L4_COCC2|nr:uncharacterized protein COCCADRAFT_39314 [Bipolaris zeicola 26-R-13]EUC30454.1 hypothetical protein COCCADRAFT_39314 [Bipolaris zeicola 26-R-13]
MALSSDTGAHVVQTMVAEAAPRVVNPYPNKVIHADIRIQSIDEEPSQDGPVQQSDGRMPESTSSAADAEYQERAAEMQNWWAEAIARNMDLPEGYSHVAVLIIKWADDLDELKTGEEARELGALFRDRFNYATSIVELNVVKKPQHQLDSYVSDFICNNDGPDNLLIVYYTGHGVFNDQKHCLELTGSLRNNVLLQDRGFRTTARATWNKAEDLLRHEDVEGDVLTILDTCYSSNFVKSSKDGHKRFELLSACAIDQTTEAPGKNSYTRALIDAIKELLDKDGEGPISTFRLYQRINMDPRRKDTPSQIWSRGKSVHYSEQHIFLAPLKLTKAHTLHLPSWRTRPRGYLTLRFGLRDPILNQQQIEFMTKALSKSFANKALMGLRKIEWVEMESAPPMSHFERVASVVRVVAQWKKAVVKKKEARQSQRHDNQSNLPHINVESANALHKRARTEAETDELPHAKRAYLDTSHPPSPPVSESSRAEAEDS